MFVLTEVLYNIPYFNILNFISIPFIIIYTDITTIKIINRKDNLIIHLKIYIFPEINIYYCFFF